MTSIHLSVAHAGPFYCPTCDAIMLTTDNTVKCVMMRCKNYNISWDLPKVILTKTVSGKR